MQNSFLHLSNVWTEQKELNFLSIETKARPPLKYLVPLGQPEVSEASALFVAFSCPGISGLVSLVNLKIHLFMNILDVFIDCSGTLNAFRIGVIYSKCHYIKVLIGAKATHVWLAGSPPYSALSHHRSYLFDPPALDPCLAQILAQRLAVSSQDSILYNSEAPHIQKLEEILSQARGQF